MEDSLRTQGSHTDSSVTESFAIYDADIGEESWRISRRLV